MFLTMLIILRTEPSNTLALIGFLIPLTPAATVFATTWSWTQEHDNDAYASRKTGYQATASALVKVTVYGSAEEHLEYIDEIRLNQQAYLNFSRLPSFLNVLLYVLRESWNAPLWYWQFIKRPYYRTHPPLEYRLAKPRSIGEKG